MTEYSVKYESRSHFVKVRGLDYHCREWVTGPASAVFGSEEQRLGRPLNQQLPTMVLLHGWMDVSASFQFMVDCFEHSWRVIAIDWRGFGLTDTPAYDHYWMADYLADLEFVLDALQLERVNLVGHSMGGNVAMMYAGVRPERIAKLVNLEGTGMPASHPNQIASRYRKFIDDLKKGARLKPYTSLVAVAARLCENNPRMSHEHAVFLAQHWSYRNEAGEFVLRADPAHKLSTPALYRVEEALSLWRRITAPTLMLLAEHKNEWRQFIDSPEYRRRLLAIPDLRLEEVAQVGHMMHHDQPQVIASKLEAFLKE